MVDKKQNSKWQITIRLDRGDGKTYVREISSRSTKTFIYLTFVAALWTTSAYIFLYIKKDPELKTITTSSNFTKSSPQGPSQDSSLEHSSGSLLDFDPSTDSVKPETTSPIIQANGTEFALDRPNIILTKETATVLMSLRKTSRKPHIEGKIAVILVLRDSNSDTTIKLSSRPGLIPLNPEKNDIQSWGLSYRAKKLVQKKIVFTLPKSTTFDDISAEITIVTNAGNLIRHDIQGEISQQSIKIGGSEVSQKNIH